MGITDIYEVLKKQHYPCYFTSNNRNSALVRTLNLTMYLTHIR